MSEWAHLEHVPRGFELLVGGDRLLRVPDHVADAFRPGDALLAVERTNEILHVPAAERQIARNAVGRAADAFACMGRVSDAEISRFFEDFARRLADDAVWATIARVNAEDVEAAKARGRSTTRLVADERLRRDMIEGLRGWMHAASRRGAIVERIEHPGWTIELVGAELGVVAFVFEGRPNVLADATGVLRGGNTVVFRIGRDALATARTIMHEALEPALADAGLPEGAVVLVDSPSHAAGWALFSDSRLALAVARGSGPAVLTLGSLAHQAGVPASLHGTGGAWLVAAESADAAAFRAAALNSLDRKVCNTLNVCCVVESRAEELVPELLGALEEAAARRGQTYKLHVRRGDEHPVPPELFSRNVTVRRADGDVVECQAELMEENELAREWEWEETPEVSLAVVESVDDAVALFNRLSPQFVACLVSNDQDEHERFYAAVNAPFVGNGFTRWVDGQYALERPELGLSNWQFGRLFGRSGVLSGDSAFTVRARARQSDPDVGR